MKHSLILLVPALLAAACTSTEPERKAPAAAGTDFQVQEASVSRGTAQVAEAAAPRTYTMSDDLRRLWNSEGFQRRFAESYIAESEVEPRVTEDERERMQEVLDLISRDRMDDAAEYLEDERDDSATATYDFTLANIRLQQDDLEGAEAAYRVAVDKFPRYRRAWKNLGLTYVRMNEPAKAIEAFTRVIEYGDSSATAYGLLGYSYASSSNYLGAESAYRMASLLDPGYLDWKMGLAEAYFKQGRFADAVALCDVLIAEQPESARMWQLQANAYLGLEKPLDAAENLELVDSLGDSTADSLNLLGRIYVNAELFDLAVDAYARRMALEEPGEIGPPLDAAKVLAGRGALAETAQLLDGIVQTYGGEDLTVVAQKDILRLRARIASSAGSGSDEHVAILQEIVELDPLDGEALIKLGEHFEAADETQRAEFYYERAAGLEKFERRAKLRHAQLLVRIEQYAEALTLLERAQAIEPSDAVKRFIEQVERNVRGR